MRISDWSSDMCSSDLEFGRSLLSANSAKAIVLLALKCRRHADNPPKRIVQLGVASRVGSETCLPPIQGDTMHITFRDSMRVSLAARIHFATKGSAQQQRDHRFAVDK